MVELKKAVKDVTSLTKAAPVALAKQREVLNQAVADLYCSPRGFAPSTLVYAWSWFPCMASKMDEYDMDALDGQLDEISERLITLEVAHSLL